MPTSTTSTTPHLPSPASSIVPRSRHLDLLLHLTWARGLVGLALVGALAAGFFLGSATKPVSRPTATDHVQTIRPGPWGDVEIQSITLECPEDLLPVSGLESKVTRWTLKGYSTDKFLELLSELGISGELREEFRSPAVLHTGPNGVELTPTKTILLELPEKARSSLYALLATFPENGADLVFVLARTADERFAAAHLSPETVKLVKTVSSEYGRYLLFADLGNLLALIPSYEERVRFVKSLTLQQTLIARLHVAPDADIDRLAAYWRNDAGSGELRSLFESLARVNGGASIDLTSLLPSGPAAQLYSFPQEESPFDHPEVRKDCHWSAFNFFNEHPDDRFGTNDRDVIICALRDDYVSVPGDPRYGDLALFFTPAGALIHSAVYLADEIVYTKNGDTPVSPWMLSTIGNLHDQYSFEVPPGQALEVKYFRSKRR